MRKTNPITPYRWRLPGFPTPNRAKRTQLPHPTPKKYETNPIPPGPRPRNAKRTQSHLRRHPDYAKRTQFPYTRCPTAPCFSETNPIYPPRPEISRTGTACRALTARNEPNFRPRLCETNPIYRTTAVLPAQPTPNYAKRTQSQHRRPQSTIHNIQSTILSCPTNDRHLPAGCAMAAFSLRRVRSVVQ